MAFSDIEGQERAARILGKFLQKDRVPSCMVFYGPDGVGKTMMAVEFAKALFCRECAAASGAKKTGSKDDDALLTGACGTCPECVSIDRRLNLDVKFVDASYQAGLRDEDQAKQRSLRVDTVRHLRKDMELCSMTGSWKVAILAHAHTLEVQAANALLKILEDAPPKTVWILVTAQRSKLPKTVESRCFPVAFAPLPPSLVARILADAGADASRAQSLAELCDGSASRALELLAAGLPSTNQDPFAAAEGLPKELHAARVKTELALYALEQAVRRRFKRGATPYHRAEPALRTIDSLRRTLRSNADPGTIMTLAHLEFERIQDT